MSLPLGARRTLAPFLLLSLALVAVTSHAATLYVSAGAAGPDGTSWATAFPKVSQALAAAQPGDEVWVARGTYPERITMREGVALYAGFAGTETARDQRDWNANATILDGQTTGTVVTAPAGLTAAAILDGFQVTRGGVVSSYATGVGGVDCTSSSPVIRNCAFSQGWGAASGISVTGTGAAPLIEGCTFTGNTKQNNRSVISCAAGTAPVIRGCTVRGNYGAGITLSGAGLVEACLVGDNGASSYGTGSGPAVSLSKSTATVQNNDLSDPDGSGVYVDGGAPLIAGNRIEACKTARGGGIYLNLSNATITGNTIARNTATEMGGGMYITGGAPLVLSNLFYANAAIQPTGNYSLASAGALYVTNVTASAPPRILNNTIVGSVATGTDPYAVLLPSQAHPVFANNVLAFNDKGLSAYYNSADPLIHHNCYWRNPVSSTAPPAGPDANGNIQQDPLFANPGNGDFHIQPGSPCRNAGATSVVPDGSLDLDGQPRVQDGTVDIGADESDGTAWTVPDRVVRVRPDGDDTADGSSWSAAMRTVSAASAAVAKAGGGEVWVAEGNYGVATVNVGTATRIYGGFRGDETSRDARPALTVPAFRAVPLSVAEGAQNVVVDRMGRVTIGRYAEAAVTNGDADNIDSYGRRVSILGNTVHGEFGGLRQLAYGTATITGNHVVGGEWGIAGIGVLTIANNVVAQCLKSGISITGGTATVTNNTVYGAVYQAPDYLSSDDASALSVGGTATVTAENNILAFSQHGVSVSTSANTTLKNNCIFGSHGAAFLGITDPTGTNGNIAADPKLDGQAYGGWQLLSGSPCQDAGDDAASAGLATDVDGAPRTAGSHVDIGASEYVPGRSTFAPVVIHVRPDGDDSADGRTWATARSSLSAACGALYLLPEGGEVWVAAGDYPTAAGVPAATYVYGGFAGTETERAQRDWHANVTNLVGDGVKTPVAVSYAAAGTIDGFVIRGPLALNSAWTSVAHCRITEENTAYTGTAVSLGEGTVQFHDNIVTGTRNYSHGVSCGSYSRALISGNLITGNAGAGVYTDNCDPVIEGNTLSGNNYGVSTSSGHPVIRRNAVLGNRNGGLDLSQGTVVVDSNLIAGNTGEGGIGGYGAPSTIVNNTVVGNTATPPYSSAAGGIQIFSNTTIANNIVAFNSAGFWQSDPSVTMASVVLGNNCVFGNTGGDYVNYADQNGIAGNITADPRFLDRAAGDFHLASDSPCRDTGDPASVAGTLDFDGLSRVTGAAVDMGAFEWSGGTQITMIDAVRALEIAAGLRQAAPDDVTRLNADPSTPGIMVPDALAIAREADPRPADAP